MPASLIRTAHGKAAKLGALTVVETPPLDELPTPNPALTERALATRKARGRPFQKGNAAAAGRGPSLTRIAVNEAAPEEQRRIHRKATSLKNKRARELAVQHGGSVSTAVHVELVAWARDTAWAEYFDRVGEATKAAQLAEKASGHGLKAIAIAEREAESREKNRPVDPFAAFYKPDDASEGPEN